MHHNSLLEKGTVQREGLVLATLTANIELVLFIQSAEFVVVLLQRSPKMLVHR